VHLVTSDQLVAYLRTALYRFDCPPAQRIGEYALDLLVDPERRQLAEHVLDCSCCADELRILREFIASEPALSPKRDWRRVIATLFTPAGHLAPRPVRGTARETSSEYHAGPVHIVLGVLQARRRGTVVLDGLVLHDVAPDAVADRDVTLLADDVVVHATRTDDLGNFAFDAVAAGSYRLEIHFADELIVVDSLNLGARS
jgi:hypothetical protein